MISAKFYVIHAKYLGDDQVAENLMTYVSDTEPPFDDKPTGWSFTVDDWFSNFSRADQKALTEAKRMSLSVNFGARKVDWRYLPEQCQNVMSVYAVGNRQRLPDQDVLELLLAKMPLEQVIEFDTLDDLRSSIEDRFDIFVTMSPIYEYFKRVLPSLIDGEITVEKLSRAWMVESMAREVVQFIK